MISECESCKYHEEYVEEDNVKITVCRIIFMNPYQQELCPCYKKRES